ncbi:MarR family transcriptional regulator [Amycolatopsis rubida]|uniref:DNA-binding transcriptional regulator, MarR family n=1 Tax=Amycolatopsis rubida TaxID=112413 RepID=A0A1I5F9G7_9PSEU|nr:MULTISPECIES: MarR family transcriptional regulator [Amycolatopsis]MYW95910.1 MarR family transcriptional regulator [Amycolatopsis rubida]NEC60900.1 MarR family transcriptional regulator [Amycolatopsis rubida]OAP27031.1 MarR family protein [Amycolatopsis sp. M39]SFO20395.1 DNA-binding transcriptional regulator, MarR family [Amycolatopsis rubida]
MTSSKGDLAHRLRPVVFRLYYLVRRETAQLLTLTQGSVLSELVGRGPSRMNRLSRLERVRMPSMTDVVRRLERLGMVTRRPDPDDGRAVLVEATPEGERFYAEMIAGREAELRARLDRLDPDERAAIDAALPALTKLIADFHRDDPAAELAVMSEGGTDPR